MTFLNFEVEFK